MNEIEIPENLELYDTIILNGIIGDCDTHDDNYETIGVKMIQKIPRLNGKTLEVVTGEFPFTKNMAEKCGWLGSYASVQMLTGDTPIDMEHIDETKIVSMEGDVSSEYYHRYSDLTGYLWTTEDWKCGGHSLYEILCSHRGEYVHLEIELYRHKNKPATSR